MKSELDRCLLMRSFAHAPHVRANDRWLPTPSAAVPSLSFAQPRLRLHINAALHTNNNLDFSDHRMLVGFNSTPLSVRPPAGQSRHGYHRLQRPEHGHPKQLRQSFVAPLRECGVEDFHCQLPRGKNFAFVTVLNPSDGQRFLSYFGT